MAGPAKRFQVGWFHSQVWCHLHWNLVMNHVCCLGNAQLVASSAQWFLCQDKPAQSGPSCVIPTGRTGAPVVMVMADQPVRFVAAHFSRHWSNPVGAIG
jgi:hypothetical protein